MNGSSSRGAQLRPVGPGVELVVGRIDHAGRFVPQQHQRAGHRGHVHRLPVAVQDQRRPLEDLRQSCCFLSSFDIAFVISEGVRGESNPHPLVHSQPCSNRYTTDTVRSELVISG